MLFRFQLRSLLLLTIAIALMVFGYVSYQRYQREHIFLTVVDQTSGIPLNQFRFRTTIRTETGETTSQWTEFRSPKGSTAIAVPIHCLVWLDIESSESGGYPIQTEELLVSPDAPHTWTRRLAKKAPSIGEPLTGQLVDRESKRPIANAKIYPLPDMEDPAISDSDGRFRLEHVGVAGFIVNHFEFERSGVRKGDTFELDRCKTIEGKVIDENGLPVHKCTVEIKKFATHEMPRAVQTDEHGQFAIPLTKSEIQSNRLEASSPGWIAERIDTQLHSDSGLLITLKRIKNTSENSDSIALGSQPQGHTVQGNVLASPTELRHIRVRLRTEEEMHTRLPWNIGPFSRESRLDRPGNFQIQNLAEGHYELVIDWKSQFFCRRPVIVQSESLTLPAIPLPDRGDVRGRVSSKKANEVVAFEEMWFSDSGRTKTTSFFTNQNGEFKIDGLLPGKWFIGQGSPEACSVGHAGHDVKEIRVTSNQITRCDFTDADPLTLEIPFQLEGFDSYHKLLPKTEQLTVGSDVSKQFLLAFPNKRPSRAELLASGKNTRQIRVTMAAGLQAYQTVHREFESKAPGEPLQLRKQPTTVFASIDSASNTKDLSQRTETSSNHPDDLWVTSFSQNRIEKVRIAEYGSNVMTSMLERGDYDVMIQHWSGWAKLKCSVTGERFFELGPLQMQPGASIDGRISLSDKQAYPTAIRITSHDEFVLERDLLGVHEEHFQFSGLPPGKWKIEIIDNNAPRDREVMKKSSVELKGTEAVSIVL
jgi:hypothetical protein